MGESREPSGPEKFQLQGPGRQEETETKTSLGGIESALAEVCMYVCVEANL